MIEPVLLPFGGDTEGDVPFESPEQVSDLHALSDAHDGVEMVGHGQRDQGCPAALLFKARRPFEDDAPATGIIEVVRAAKLVAQRDEDRVGCTGPGWAMVGECLA
jgi:hypothetical protein